MNNAGHRKIQLYMSYRFGQFYGGSYNKLEAGVTIKMKGNATFQLGTNIVRGDFPLGKFSENLYQARPNLNIHKIFLSLSVVTESNQRRQTA